MIFNPSGRSVPWIYRLILSSAAILVHTNNVLASECLGDVQMQAQDLLSGTVGRQAKTIDKSLQKSADGDQTSNVDPQDQARQLILGNANFGKRNGWAIAPQPRMNAIPVLSTQGDPRTYPDPQESARRMILGEASTLTPRKASTRPMLSM
jgi:hypothetical protein